MAKSKHMGACRAAAGRIKAIFRPYVLLWTVIVLIALNAISLNFVFARYKTSATGSESARVAKFAPEIDYNEKWEQVSTFSDLSDTKDVSLPFAINTEDAEVKIRAIITVEHNGPLPLKYDLYRRVDGGADMLIAANISSV